jgi:hypothetical protein
MSVRKSKDIQQVDTTTAAIRTHAKTLEPYLNENYGMTIEEAVRVLENIPAALLSWIYYLSPSLRPDEPSTDSKQ